MTPSRFMGWEKKREPERVTERWIENLGPRNPQSKNGHKGRLGVLVYSYVFLDVFSYLIKRGGAFQTS